MIIAPRTVNADRQIEADICIVGSGPAGITLARELSSIQSLHVCLLESGSSEFEPTTQSLYKGEIVSNFTTSEVIRNRPRTKTKTVCAAVVNKANGYV